MEFIVRTRKGAESEDVMKLTEEEIIKIQELAKRIVEEAQLKDLRTVQESIIQLQELVVNALDTRFNNWYDRMSNYFMH